MLTLFDPSSVKLRATNTSNIHRLVHVEAHLSGVPSKFIAERLQRYLADQELTSSVGLKWDGDNQTAIFRTFVAKFLPVDAVGYISGLLGPQAQAFA